MASIKNLQVMLAFFIVFYVSSGFCVESKQSVLPTENEKTDSSSAIFFHHNFEQTVALMNKVNKACPEITRIYNLSEPSVEGRNLTVLEITENPGIHKPGEILIFSFFLLCRTKWIR